MSNDEKCVCEHEEPVCFCGCTVPAEEAKSEPAPESVYERARNLINACLDRFPFRVSLSSEVASVLLVAVNLILERDEARANLGRSIKAYDYEVNRVHELVLERDKAEHERDAVRRALADDANRTTLLLKERDALLVRVAECEALLARCSPKMDPPKG